MQSLFARSVRQCSQELHPSFYFSPGRFFSSLARLHKHTNAFTRAACAATHDPVWLLIPRLRWENDDNSTSEALERCRVSRQEYSDWKPVVFSPSFEGALDILSDKNFILPPGVDILRTLDDITPPLWIPAWVILALTCHKVRTPSDAQHNLLRLTLGNINAIETPYQPSLLTLTTHSLAHFGIIAPMRRLVDLFLLHTVQFCPFHFNMFLQALSSFTKCEEVANLALTILEAMTSRQIPLWLDTYRALMTDRFVTLQLTKHLRARMMHEGIVPRADHLEAYLRIFSQHGAIHEAQEYLKAIHEYCIQHSLTPPYGPLTSGGSNTTSKGDAHPANTLYLKSMQNDRASAFHYLHNLLKLESRCRQEGTLPKKSTVTRPHHSHALTTFWSMHKQSIDVFDWTTALVAAANDRRTTSHALIRLFENARTKTKTFHPTIATYTVLLRGLLWKKAYGEALEIWNQLIDSGLTLDRKALTVGVQVLTRAGHPQEAFYLLASFADERPLEPMFSGTLTRPQNTPKPPLPGSAPSSPSLPVLSATRNDPLLSTSHPKPFTSSWINIIVVNEFLVSLLRIRRPDVVFKIWDNLELLYNVLPDDVTLNVLLKSALLAVKMDRESVRGAMAHFALQTPFRTRGGSASGPETGNDQRAEVTRDVMRTLERPESPSVVGIWRGRSASDVAREIFRGMVFGNWPQTQYIKSPVVAIRKPGTDGVPIIELAKSIVEGLSHKVAPVLPAQPDKSPDEKSEKCPKSFARDTLEGIIGPGAIPSVYPSSATFLAYIKLLGLSSPSYTHEIPLVLAWMRHLSVRPTRQMLSISLVFWAEVGLRGPIFEDWAEKQGYSEYGRLERWIAEWAAEGEGEDEGVKPTEEDICKALWAVAKMRDKGFGRGAMC